MIEQRRRTVIRTLPRLKRSRWRDQVAGLLFASPFLIGFLVFNAYPFFASLYYSFTDFALLGSPKWLGLQNYLHLIHDSVFLKALSNNAYMVFIGLPIYLVWALLTAFLLNQALPAQGLFRSLYFIPAVTPSVAASYVFLWVLNPRTGIGYYLSKIGITPPLWFNDPAWAKPGLILFWLWTVGFDTVIFLAALQGVPQDLHEAAEIDGAGRWRRGLSIDLPLISPSILFVGVTSIIWALSYFTQAYIIAGAGSDAASLTGGRESSMLFLSIYIYANAFQYLKMGYAAAMAWLMFILNAIVTFLMLRFTRRRVFYS
jgi:multiple sugar transport system permease protein